MIKKKQEEEPQKQTNQQILKFLFLGRGRGKIKPILGAQSL
jgi:hypothetical protein